MNVQMQNRSQDREKDIRRRLQQPQSRFLLAMIGAFFGGFCLSAAALDGRMQPFCLGALCAGLPGWLPMAFALGSSLGYRVFWGNGGIQALIWLALGLPAGVVGEKMRRRLLPPVLAALIVAIVGMTWRDGAIGTYLLRIALAFASTLLAQRVREGEGTLSRRLAVGVAVLALAQIAPTIWLNLGMVAAGALVSVSTLPTVALAGLALDVAGVAAVPMTAVLFLAYFPGRSPALGKFRRLLPAVAYLAGMILCGQTDWTALPALLVGGLTGGLIPQKQATVRQENADPIRDGLEAVGSVLQQMKYLLQQVSVSPPDEEALMLCAAERACDGCPRREGCAAAQSLRLLPLTLLRQSNIDNGQIPADCEEKQRPAVQLQRAQEHYRLLLAERRQQKEYRDALLQQYGLLAGFLRDLADRLHAASEPNGNCFRPEVAVCSRGRGAVNGDRCFRFAGERNRYYVLLCDGMGTGEEAAYEAKTAGSLLQRMLSVGVETRDALQSINSLCALRGSAGAVTVDLAEADLMTGRVSLYKWGAAPSWRLTPAGAERIGQENPPPGIAPEETREVTEKISLQGEAVLVMLSDGVDGSAAVAALKENYDQPGGFLAALLLEAGADEVPDDATAVVLRLHRLEEEGSDGQCEA